MAIPKPPKPVDMLQILMVFVMVIQHVNKYRKGKRGHGKLILKLLQYVKRDRVKVNCVNKYITFHYQNEARSQSICCHSFFVQTIIQVFIQSTTYPRYHV